MVNGFNILDFLQRHWPAIVTSIMAAWSAYRNRKWKRSFSTQINVLIDSSQSFQKTISENFSDKPLLVERANSLNHSTIFILSILPSLARRWIKVSKKESEWEIWEQKLMVSMTRYRIKNKILRLFKLKPHLPKSIPQNNKK